MATDIRKWDADPTLYLFTSLTAGSSHVVTATSRIETILKANRIPFTYIDTATNEGAKALYSRRGQNKKFPLLVKEGYVLGGITEVEEWNEFGELQDVIGPAPTVETSITTAPVKQGFTSPYPLNVSTDVKKAEPATSSSASITSKKGKENEDVPRVSIEAQQAMATAGSEAASIAASKKSAPSIKSNLSTHTLPDTLPDRTNESMSISSPLSIASPRFSSDSAIPAPLASASSTSPLGEPRAGSTELRTHRGSSISVATDDAIKALEDALAIPEEKEPEITEDAISIQDDTASSKEEVAKVASSTASTAVIDDKSSVRSAGAAPSSTAPTEKEESERPAPIAKDNHEPASPSAPGPTLEVPDNTNTPRLSAELNADKGSEVTRYYTNTEQGESAANKEVADDNEKGAEEKKGKDATGDVQQAVTRSATFRASIASFFSACFAGRSKTRDNKRRHSA